MVVDVGLEPRHLRRTGPRAVDERVRVAAPGLLPHPLDDLGHRAAVLVRRRRRRCGRCASFIDSRDRVGHEDQVGALADARRAARPARPGSASTTGSTKPGWLKYCRSRSSRGASSTSADRVGEVLAVLPAAGVRRVGAGHEAGRAGHAVVGHLPDRVGEVAGPSCGCPSRPAGRAGAVEVLAQRREQRPVLVVDRRPAAEQEVVLADLLEPLARDAAAAGHVLQERHDVLGPLGPAERDEQQRVVRARRREPWCPSY